MKACVFLTRPEGKNQALAALLNNAGIPNCIVPALQVQPIQGSVNAVSAPGNYQLVIFVSGQAVNFYLKAIGADVAGFSWPEQTYAATVGWASARPLYDSGIIPSTAIIHPEINTLEQDSEALWPLLQGVLPDVQRALIVRGERGREWLGSRLELNGIDVTRLAIYARRPVIWDARQQLAVQQGLDQSRPPAVFLLTSSESVAAVIENITSLGLLTSFARAHFVVLHSRIQDYLCMRLKAAGQPTPTMVKICTPTDTAIAQALQDSVLPDTSS